MRQKSVWSPGAGVTGNSELSSVSAGNRTQVLCKKEQGGFFMAELSLQPRNGFHCYFSD